MNTMIRTMLALTVVAVASGCAQLSPQQVAFDPSLDAEAIPKGGGTTVSIEVKDRRKSNEIGTRGGTYPESSVITPKGDLRAKLLQITEEVINRAGYRQESMNPEVAMTVSLDELSYSLEDIDAVRKSATAAAKMSVQLSRNGASYSNSFRAQRTKETFRYPSTEENAELLNYVFESALERMFADPGLAKFLD